MVDEGCRRRCFGPPPLPRSTQDLEDDTQREAVQGFSSLVRDVFVALSQLPQLRHVTFLEPKVGGAAMQCNAGVLVGGRDLPPGRACVLSAQAAGTS